jgi:uncharacterized protein YjbJ (UPF0337 family)
VVCDLDLPVGFARGVPGSAVVLYPGDRRGATVDTERCPARAVLLPIVVRRGRCVMGATSDKAKGKAKEAIGTVTGDKDLEAEGKADRRGGEAKEKVEGVVHSVEEKAGEVIDKVKDALHRK